MENGPIKSFLFSSTFYSTKIQCSFNFASHWVCSPINYSDENSLWVCEFVWFLSHFWPSCLLFTLTRQKEICSLSHTICTIFTVQEQEKPCQGQSTLYIIYRKTLWIDVSRKQLCLSMLLQSCLAAGHRKPCRFHADAESTHNKPCKTM